MVMLARGLVAGHWVCAQHSGRSGAGMASAKRPKRRYLLRLWLVADGGPVWRATLEDPTTAERHGFSSLERLFAFLTAETRDLAAAAEWEEQATGVPHAGGPEERGRGARPAVEDGKSGTGEARRYGDRSTESQQEQPRCSA
jgi:hypothetical protein